MRQHGEGKRRTWRKLHLAVNKGNNDLLSVERTTNAVDDAELLPELLEQVEETVGKFGGDGAYDRRKVYDELEERKIAPIIPPREDAAYWTYKEGNDLEHPRNKAVEIIADLGRPEWERQSGFHRRSKVEVRIKCAIINKFNQLGMPISVKVA